MKLGPSALPTPVSPGMCSPACLCWMGSSCQGKVDWSLRSQHLALEHPDDSTESHGPRSHFLTSGFADPALSLAKWRLRRCESPANAIMKRAAPALVAKKPTSSMPHPVPWVGTSSACVETFTLLCVQIPEPKTRASGPMSLSKRHRL